MTKKIFAFSKLSEDIKIFRFLTIGLSLGLVLHLSTAEMFGHKLIFGGAPAWGLSVVGMLLFALSFKFKRIQKDPNETQLVYFLGVTGYFAFQFYYNDFNFEHELLLLLVLSILSLPFFSIKQNIFFFLS